MNACASSRLPRKAKNTEVAANEMLLESNKTWSTNAASLAAMHFLWLTMEAISRKVYFILRCIPAKGKPNLGFYKNPIRSCQSSDIQTRYSLPMFILSFYWLFCTLLLSKFIFNLFCCPSFFYIFAPEKGGSVF
jgi:hypothetical protein